MENNQLLKLDNQLCFALYVCSKEVIKKYKPLLEPLGLTYTGYIALLALWENDNATVKELGERLYLDSGTLTPVLKKLESAGYIERRRGEKDERTVRIILTKEGEALKEKAICVPSSLISSISGENFSQNEASELLSMLKKLAAMLENNTSCDFGK